MSLHVLSHPWEVQAVGDGTLVTITPRDLDVGTVAVLADELCELALERSPPTLYLDLGKVSRLSGVVCGKLLALQRRLHQAGGRLVLQNLNPALVEEPPAESDPAHG
jgi:anti-anti-sigma regulatory factor